MAAFSQPTKSPAYPQDADPWSFAPASYPMDVASHAMYAIFYPKAAKGYLLEAAAPSVFKVFQHVGATRLGKFNVSLAYDAPK